MEYLYLACLLISVGMLFWLKIFDVRNSITQFISLLIIVISNLGFYFLSISTSLEEAILAKKITYVGGIFLPVFYFFLVLEICHVELNKKLAVFLMGIQCVLYGFACSIGKNQLFYKSAELIVRDGKAVLEKVHGPIHVLFLISIFGYMLAAIAVAIYSLMKKKSVNRRSVLSMVILCAVAVATYASENVMNLEDEIVPFAFVILMIGALIPVYDSNLFTVYENTEIIDEQLGKVGFLTFDMKRRYKGCNEFMEAVFPELSNYQIGQKIRNCSKELQMLINQITSLEELYKKNPKSEHVHIDLEVLFLNDRYYEGMIHIVTNAFGSLKGYTIELRDDTEDHRMLALKEHYNEELSEAVKEKTGRIRSIQQKVILGMAQMVESRDLSTGGHIKRTSDVVKIFANKLLDADLGFKKDFLELVIRSAPMHDLGKIGVDDAILRKQGRYTDEEYNAMKQHSEIGYRMVSEILADVEEPDFVSVAENVAHYHHEKVNGMGYPAGLKGKEIPVEARIMALADVFDALVSKRCYKEAFSYDKAFSIIEHDAGTHFDKQLATVFISCRPELEAYYNKN